MKRAVVMRNDFTVDLSGWYPSRAMQRRDLIKLSPLALASTAIGHRALAETPPAPSQEAIFNVRAFGATGDGRTVDTPAINKAIAAVAEAGGGTLVISAG